MNTTNTTSEYLLLFRGNCWDRSLSPEELQKSLTAFFGWFERLSSTGVLKAGQPLTDDARIVSGKNGSKVADGPFAESKEAVAGYFLIRAESLDAAVAIARQCPTLEHGSVVEVRPIAAECQKLSRAQEAVATEPVAAGV
jgi:hypothetical protein